MDKQWYRGRVTGISESEDGEIIEIYYIDYGNAELVTKDKYVYSVSSCEMCVLSNPYCTTCFAILSSGLGILCMHTHKLFLVDLTLIPVNVQTK